MEIISLVDVSKQFGESIVLQNINLSIELGTITGFVGRNGSGKTILLKIICGLMMPTKGTVTVMNERIGIDRDFPPSTGILIESPEFIPYQTGYRNLYNLSLINGKASKERIKDVLRLVGLDPESRKTVRKYSLGMRQRLGIAQALMDNPDLLILDEPMNGLDRCGAAEMRDLFASLRNEGKTILLASHIAEDINYLCDNVYEMQDGSIHCSPH